MFSGEDPILLSILILTVAATIWNYSQTQMVIRRLNSLEKQHLALVAELEERLYQDRMNS